MPNEDIGSEPEQSTRGEVQSASPGTPSVSSAVRTNFLSQRFSYVLRSPSRFVIIDPKFSGNSRRYLFQAGLATLAMLALLLFIDSLSQAALAAGLGSSVIILFVHPSSRTATSRSLGRRPRSGSIAGVGFLRCCCSPPRSKHSWTTYRRCGTSAWPCR